MNRSLIGPRRPRMAAAATGAALLGLSGCANPLATEPDEYGPAASPETLRTVATLRLEDRARPPEEPKPITEPPKDPYEGMEKLEVSIEQCRAWALQNNLDLQVALIDPTIQHEALSAEEAKFEAVFRTTANYNNLDNAVSSTLQSGQAQILDITPGVTIPLRNGSTVTVQLPLNRTETNNSFTTLNPSYSSDLSFSLSQPLLRNAGRRANSHSIRLAALDSQIAQARTKLEVIRQLAGVDRAYWRLYAAKRLLEVRQEQYELARTQLERAERRYRAQVAPEVEVIRAQEGLAARLEDIITADNQLRDVQRDLKRIIHVPGLEMGSRVLFELSSQPDPVAYDLDPDEFARSAITNRMEMLELELQLAQDYSSIDFARNQALPLFTLDYSYQINGLGADITGAFKVLRDNRFENWSVGATFERSLGNEAAESRVHQAILRRLQRLATREARKLSISQEVYNTVDQIGAAWQRIMAARQTVILAARTLRAEQNQFEVGARTSTDVLDAATRLADAQSSEIIALTDYQISQVDLAFATGTLLGAMKVDWAPRDPRGPGDFVGEKSGRVPLGPKGVEIPEYHPDFLPDSGRSPSDPARFRGGVR